MRRISSGIAVAESAALVIYAAALMISAIRVKSTVGSPVIETIIYLIFAALIYLVGRGLAKKQNWARTPYLLVQLFIGIVAYTLFVSTDVIYKVAGIIFGLVALAGLIALFKTPLEN